MRIRHVAKHELEVAGCQPRPQWLDAVRERLRGLPDHPYSRVLVAEEDGRPWALLGMRLYWSTDGRLVRAVICVLGVDPKHNRMGIGSRLIRFAEGIVRIHGCMRVDVAPELEGWGEGRCWLGLGYDGADAGLYKELGSPVHRMFA